MNFSDLFKIIDKNRYYVFSFNDLLLFFPEESKENLRKMLYRWRRKGWIQALKRGLYEITYPKDLAIPDLYIANALYKPSYISLETALSNYSIIPEVSMAATSVTPKPTRRFKNKHGLFLYRTVKPPAFTGYHVTKHGEFNILMAEPEKAVVDYLYFKIYRKLKKKFDFSEVFRLKEERFDLDILSKLNRRKMKKYASLYKFDLRGFYAQL
jgi:predicted transcriptional regulator of viral defense system